MASIQWIEYAEINEERGNAPASFPKLGEAVASVPQKYEAEIVAYLREAPNYSAMGKVVRDVLDPSNGAVLYPGSNTDGVYIWPMELAYYVTRYHVRLPQHFIERMASLNWHPPSKDAIDWDKLYRGLATE